MLNGTYQLEPEEVRRVRKAQSKWIRVERVICLAKIYKISKKELNSNLVTLGSRIIHVCFYLCNFRPCNARRLHSYHLDQTQFDILTCVLL